MGAFFKANRQSVLITGGIPDSRPVMCYVIEHHVLCQMAFKEFVSILSIQKSF